MYYISEKKPHSFLWSVVAVLTAVVISVGYFELRTKDEPGIDENAVIQTQNDTLKVAEKSDFADINKYKNVVVGVSDQNKTNSGFFVSSDGYVLSSGFDKDDAVSVCGDDTVDGVVTWASDELGICLIKTNKTNTEHISLEGYANAQVADVIAASSIVDEIGYYVNVANISSVENVVEDALGEGTKILTYIFSEKISSSGRGALVSDKNSNPVGIVISSAEKNAVKILPFRIAGAVIKKVIRNNEVKLPDIGIAFEESAYGIEIRITDKEKVGFTSGLRDGDLVKFINRNEIKNINDAYSELILYTDYPEIVFSVVRNGESDEIRIIV